MVFSRMTATAPSTREARIRPGQAATGSSSQRRGGRSWRASGGGMLQSHPTLRAAWAPGRSPQTGFTRMHCSNTMGWYMHDDQQTRPISDAEFYRNVTRCSFMGYDRGLRARADDNGLRLSANEGEGWGNTAHRLAVFKPSTSQSSSRLLVPPVTTPTALAAHDSFASLARWSIGNGTSGKRLDRLGSERLVPIPSSTPQMKHTLAGSTLSITLLNAKNSSFSYPPEDIDTSTTWMESSSVREMTA